MREDKITGRRFEDALIEFGLKRRRNSRTARTTSNKILRNNEAASAKYNCTPSFVDYFVVTALEDESNAVARHLDSLRPQRAAQGFCIGYLNSTSELGDDGVPKRVLLYLPGSGQGTKAAQSLTEEGIRKWNPSIVLLVGIAGGFHEHGVCLGDVLVPEYVDPYELAKKTPDGVARREPPFRVSAHGIWQLTRGIAASGEEWYRNIKRRRPDRRERAFPKIVAPDRGILGSGDKNLADERAEERQYLKKAHGERAIGFEMEASGVGFVCSQRGFPFAVIKSVQDNGTVDKDKRDKDRWRLYACDAAATVAQLIMSRWNPSVVLEARDVRSLLKAQGTPIDYMFEIIRSSLQATVYSPVSELVRNVARSSFDQGRLTEREKHELVNRISKVVFEELPSIIESAYADAVSNLDRFVAIDRHQQLQELSSRRNALVKELPVFIISEIENLVMELPTSALIMFDLKARPDD